MQQSKYIAFLVGFFIPGFGHVVIKQYGSAILYLVLFIAALFVTFLTPEIVILPVAVWIVALIDLSARLHKAKTS